MADARLHLLHLSSPALPVGAYAYSQGLEYAVESGWVTQESLPHWLRDSLQFGLASVDLPILLRAMTAMETGDTAALNHWNDLLRASRETAELQLEDTQIGSALWRLLQGIGEENLPTLTQTPGYPVAFAVACQRWSISGEDAARAYSFSWLENQVTAATKLVPLGQTDAQRLLLALMEHIDDACRNAAAIDDSAVGLSLPGLAIASSRHERQHTRLFRS